MSPLPLEVSGDVHWVVAHPPEPVIDRATGQPRLDRDGRPLSTVQLVGFTPRGGEVVPVRVAGDPPTGLVVGQAVRVRGLTVTPWSMGDRAGISYRAEAIEATAPATTPATTARQSS